MQLTSPAAACPAPQVCRQEHAKAVCEWWPAGAVLCAAGAQRGGHLQPPGQVCPPPGAISCDQLLPCSSVHALVAQHPICTAPLHTGLQRPLARRLQLVQTARPAAPKPAQHACLLRARSARAPLPAPGERCARIEAAAPCAVHRWTLNPQTQVGAGRSTSAICTRCLRTTAAWTLSWSCAQGGSCGTSERAQLWDKGAVHGGGQLWDK